MLRTALFSLTFLQANAAERPNIVFILVDDLGYMDIGANNSQSFYETPNIDALAKRGMRFTDGYAACPVCSPTRASILTGKYPQRTGVTDYIGAPQPEKWKRPTKLLPAPYAEELALKETTLAEAFKAQGYATFFAGKWHLGPTNRWPENQGFDINMGGGERGGPYGGNKYFSPYGNPRLPDGPPGEHLPDRLATETAKFIAANKSKPFFAYLSFYSVHTPLMAREDLQKKYEAKAKFLANSEPKWGQELERKVRLVQDHAVYAGMVEAMDQAVGKVLKAIDDAGVSSNTIVVFTSDNGGLSTSEGWPTSNLPLRGGKGWAYEGGVREPLIIYAPGVTKAGSVSATVTTSPDFYPTLLDLAGLPALPQPHQDGVSFVKSLRGEKQSRGPVFWHYPHYGNQGGAPYGAVRAGDFKLIEWYEDMRVELYDLKQDLSEQHNLAQENPAQAAELTTLLHDWRKQVGAKMPTPNPAYQPGVKSLLELDGSAMAIPAITVPEIKAVPSSPKKLPTVSAARVKELQNLRWGMFICWSFSTFSGKEWTPGIKSLTHFNPTGCDTEQWGKAAKEAGMGYILFLTKHHDGFCLWDTQTTGRKVTKSPLGRDVLAELKKSCDKYGLKLALYFSEGEWRQPGGFDDPAAPAPKKINQGGSNPELKKAQLRELLTGYGPIEYIWFDHAIGDGGLTHAETLAFCKSLQPDCFIGFNHGDQTGADIRLGEMGRPGPLHDHAAAGPHMKDAPSQNYRLAEFTYPILPEHQGGANWFYSLPKHDQLCHPADKLYADYLGAVKYGNVFALNVGPDYAGKLRDIDVRTLRQVGEMIRSNQKTAPPTKP